MKFWASRLGLFLAVGVGLAGMVRASALLWPVRLNEIQAHCGSTRFTDRNGRVIGELVSRDQEHTLHVPLSGVSASFVQAMLQAEDKRFFQHGGVDWVAMGRAALQRLPGAKKRSGGSTITLQLARMISPAPRTLRAKLSEIYLAWRLEAGLGKSEILEAYVNRLPMGGNLYGVEAAARHYFGVSAATLDLAQATLLAAIPQNPNRLRLDTDLQGAHRRRSLILHRMVDAGQISLESAALAEKEAIGFKSPVQLLTAPHLLLRLANEASCDDRQIQTTLDSGLQAFVQSQVTQTLHHIRNGEAGQAAVLVVDNRTGDVLAYVGSPDFDEQEAGTVDGVTALRQPGSTLKPFLYGLAFEKHAAEPGDVLADIPTTWDMGGVDSGKYAPRDYSGDFMGPIRASAALANSLNVPAVRLLERVGIDAFYQRLGDLGFDFPQYPEYYGLGLVLGDAEVNLESLVRAYVTMAREGQRLPIRYSMPEHEVGFSAVPQVGDSDEWRLIAQILADPYLRAESYGIRSILRLPFDTAVKTGTSSGFRDNWTVGFTADYTVGVWVGNFNGAPMRGISGVMGAAPLFANIMVRLNPDVSKVPRFSMPNGYVKLPVCPLSGKSPGKHCPAVTLEFVAKEQQKDFVNVPCSWHQPGGQVVLPSLYHGWAESHGATVNAAKHFLIAEPRDGAVFEVTSELPPEAQKVKLSVTGGYSGTHWRVDDQAFAGEDDVLWQMKTGEHTITAYHGDQIQTIHIRVVNRQLTYQAQMEPPGWALTGEK